ncbi:MAG: hypothetical protein MPJ78_19125 [Hyphomicrobiaceae bacterium]|nr:hypothetical protein [Hyphomicrobiaceae bacterium]
MSRTPFKSTPSLIPSGPLAPHRSLTPIGVASARDALGPIAPPRRKKPLGPRLALAFALGLSFALVGGITLGLAPIGEAPQLAKQTQSPVDAPVAAEANASAVPLVKTSAPVK